MFHVLRTRWHAPGGYREILNIAVPLILSTGAWTVQQFVDRLFLTWYSPETIAASMPAGMLHFTFVSVFIGITGYVNTFVSQYHGAGQHHRIGPALWQGTYVALAGALFFLGLSFAAGPLFDLVGHAPEIRVHEVTYFRILCYGVLPFIASSSFSAFFSGLGRTWPVMWVNTAATGVNIVCNYLLVFGNCGAPRMGIAGAAVGTIASGAFACCLFMALVLHRNHRERYNTWRGRVFHRELFGRLLRFGLPAGIQFFIDIAGFSLFLLFIGRLGTVELAATNIAFNLNTFAFMPMIGMGIAASALVGRFQGMRDPDRAAYSTYSCMHLTLLYVGIVAASYVLLPDMYLFLYGVGSSDPDFHLISGMAVVLLRFVALYALFDSLTIVFSSALKGAGDTRFLMFMSAGLVSAGLVLPSFLAIVVFGASVITGWIILTAYVIVMGGAFVLRFRSGSWRHMRVIEESGAAV